MFKTVKPAKRLHYVPENAFGNVSTNQVYSDSSIEVAALLTFSGGFLDVFTYLWHGGVFANAMTGIFGV